MCDIFVNILNILEYICQKREMILYMFIIIFQNVLTGFCVRKSTFCVRKSRFCVRKATLCTENKKQNILQLF